MVHPKRMTKKITNCLTNLGSISSPFFQRLEMICIFFKNRILKMYLFNIGYYEEFLELFQERKEGKQKKGEIRWVWDWL
jgi:hypothetical protein